MNEYNEKGLVYTKLYSFLLKKKRGLDEDLMQTYMQVGLRTVRSQLQSRRANAKKNIVEELRSKYGVVTVSLLFECLLF